MNFDNKKLFITAGWTDLVLIRFIISAGRIFFSRVNFPIREIMRLLQSHKLEETKLFIRQSLSPRKVVPEDIFHPRLFMLPSRQVTIKFASFYCSTFRAIKICQQ